MLSKLFADYWEQKLKFNPEFASSVGDRRYNSNWSDLGEKAVAQKSKWFTETFKKLAKAKAKSPSEKISQKILQFSISAQNDLLGYPSYYLGIDQMTGLQNQIAFTFQTQPNQTKKDLDDALKRMQKVPKLLDQTIELLKKGIKEGYVYPKEVFPQILAQIKASGAGKFSESTLAHPFLTASSELAEKIRKDVISKGEKLYDDQVRPGFIKLFKFLNEEYQLHTRNTIGYAALPEGDKWYESMVRYHTTLDLSPLEIHEIGLKKVATLEEQMKEVLKKCNFNGNFEEFHLHLKDSPGFRFETREEVLRAYRDIGKRADYEIPKFFKTLPRTPYGIAPTPKAQEPGCSFAYYIDGSLETGRAGCFYANLRDVSAHLTYGMETLLLHEAVPGHHLQIALASESELIPKFQKYEWFTAYLEGWALYAETLGYKMGFFTDPHNEFGHLQAAMFRATRLVVDTGLHSQGWGRQQAIDYMVTKSGMGRDEVEVEVDRYLVWPGQALSYMMGRIKIEEIRDKAMKKLKNKFDIRTFHDQILLFGGMPLSVLENHVDNWLKKA